MDVCRIWSQTAWVHTLPSCVTWSKRMNPSVLQGLIWKVTLVFITEPTSQGWWEDETS